MKTKNTMLHKMVSSTVKIIRKIVVERPSKESIDEIEDFKRFLTVQIATFFIGLFAVERSVLEQRDALREKQVIIFGKRASGIDLVGKALYAICSNDEDKSHQKPSFEMNMMNAKLNILSSGIEELETYNKEFKRNIKITYLHLDDVTSLSANAMSPLLTSEDYVVVYCFPISHRFTNEDWNLLKRYLPHQERADFKRTNIAFTFSERLDLSPPDDYIKTLPDQLQNFIAECEGKYLFINSSNEKSTDENKDLKSLIEPEPVKNIKLKLCFALFTLFQPFLSGNRLMSVLSW